MISFLLNNEVVHTDMPSGMTVLDFIRYQKHLKGTKIGCREGDCGACILMVGEIRNDKLHYRVMTSCLMPLSNAQNKHIVTIEGLNPTDGSLTVVQNALVEENGTQCGFCTPGFVMSLTSFCITQKENTTSEAITAIDGNICRCTGYKSIERAAHRIIDIMQLQNGLEALPYAIEKKIIPEWFIGAESGLRELMSSTISTENESTIHPRMIISGGTDLYVQIGEDLPHLDAKTFFDNNTMKMINET